ncbi:Protein kinase-like protein [Gracilaria domingensis]|nr:Protein kinase-like protein [Gracilaria domingensis]
MNAPTARQVIEEELHKLGLAMDVSESLNFQIVLGSASIAQVHRGRLRNGNVDVAVKIQYPNIESLMMADLANFRLLGEILQRTELKFDLIRPVQELSRQLVLNSTSKTKRETWLRFGLVSRRLLVRTFLDGIPLTKLDGALEKRGKQTVRLVGRRIIKNLTACYGKMILTDGFFQADCTCLISYRHAYVIPIPFLTFRMCAYLFRYIFAGHPGNIIVRNDRVDIGLLDFGQTKRFSNETRLAFVTLVDAMARKDTTGVATGLEELGIRVGHKPGREKRRGLAKHALTLEEKMAYTMFDTAKIPGVSDNPFGEESTM